MNNTILENTSIKEAISLIEINSPNGTLFVINHDFKLLGSITDGDIRRGIINGCKLSSSIAKIYSRETLFFVFGSKNLNALKKARNKGVRMIPLVDDNNKLLKIIDLTSLKSFLPVDVVIMAGGKGKRLLPFTLDTPKPMLKINGVPLIQKTLETFLQFGISNYWISINYLGNQIIDHFDKLKISANINYIKENKPMGTIGALSSSVDFLNDHIIVTNGDVITDLNFEEFYLDFLENDADVSFVVVPYSVTIPYGVVEVNDNNELIEIREKPSYTYYSNSGIYIFKRNLFKHIPKNIFYDATTFLVELQKNNYKIITYPFSGKWIDIGSIEDFKKVNS